jgi:Putative zinc- or iron-chelating domain
MIHENLMEKYGYLQVSQQLAGIVAKLDGRTAQNVFERIEFSMAQIKAAMTVAETPLQIMEGVNEVMDDEARMHKPPPAPDKVQCKKGCAACCHIQVAISPIEAQAIWEYCQMENIRIDINYLRSQATLTEKSHPYSPHSACVFLSPDKTCKIYPMRPLNCRKYEVISPAILCDIKKSGTHGVIQFANIHQEILAAALWNCSPGHNSIARSLLQTRPK